MDVHRYNYTLDGYSGYGLWRHVHVYRVYLVTLAISFSLVILKLSGEPVPPGLSEV